MTVVFACSPVYPTHHNAEWASQTLFSPSCFSDCAIQGDHIPIVVFKVFSSGNSINSAPFFIDVEPPHITDAVGVFGSSAPVVASTDGTTRIRLTGTNIGANGTRIVFLSSIARVSEGVFTDCARGMGFVECKAPKGVGATSSDGLPL